MSEDYSWNGSLNPNLDHIQIKRNVDVVKRKAENNHCLRLEKFMAKSKFRITSFEEDNLDYAGTFITTPNHQCYCFSALR